MPCSSRLPFSDSFRLVSSAFSGGFAGAAQNEPRPRDSFWRPAMARCLPLFLICAAVTALLLGTLRALPPARPAFAPIELGPDEPVAPQQVPPPGPHADRYQRELEAEDDLLHASIMEHPRDADE